MSVHLPFLLWRCAIVTALLLGAAHVASAEDAGPRGRWLAASRLERGYVATVVVTVTDGVLEGRIESLVDSSGQPVTGARCTRCFGGLKDTPLIGFRVLGGPFKLNKEGAWTGGFVWEPESGRRYDSEVSVDKNGRELHVLGYFKFPSLGETTTWTRK